MVAVLAKANMLLLRVDMNRGDMLSQKRASILGALFLCFALLLGSPAKASLCSGASSGDLSAMERAKVKRVVDGDTIWLQDGRKVRLIGVNAPELGKKGRQSEPFSVLAKQRLIELVGDSALIYLKVGEEAKDRYGRLLAHVFTHKGVSAEVVLVREGLGFAIAIPPNIAMQDCLRQAQIEARTARRGVWNDVYYAPRSALNLKRSDTGFRVVTGRLERVILKPGSTWWLLFEGALAVMIPASGQEFFERKALQELVGRELIVSGWLIKKNLSAKQKAKKYKPYLMSVKHPAAFIAPLL
ncbi:thermonuclease family protein [Alkalimarinus sediminis]|uniref:Thermonuclease family protein n=1 Tax=Alkalimarinus sediminis TaxID=1632866 RepID=A0A9E8KPY5_9ALTE|nr:thermonuclease family protein [Alkalimarinus sediminis]UZW74032.1 thermonuclease family protein [Alkalimarinus sediminis]